MRKPFPKNLNKAAASPVGDANEFRIAFEAVKKAFPKESLTYVGTDGAEHFFQSWGDKTAFVVPVSKGWKARA